MMKLMLLPTGQRAYKGITHSRWGASWNWRRRRVGDDEERRSLSPEPQTDSRSALPGKIRAWLWLRVVKHDESFSLIFFSPNTNIWSWSWGRWSSRGPTRQGGAPPTLVERVWAPWPWFFCQYFLLFLKIISVKFQVIPRTFVSAQR